MTADGQISFPISFSDTNYVFVSTARNMNSSASNVHVYAGSGNNGERAVNSIWVRAANNATGRDWFAIGK
ncbi:MAG: hypothetical protein IJV12_00575 [Acidaminococcaceae bacterium]|nr:hypothetical protein [Acidaminococcaceae bacterium]